MLFFFFFKQKTAYEMRISDWSSDVCSSDLRIDMAACAGRQRLGSAAKWNMLKGHACDLAESFHRQVTCATSAGVTDQHGAWLVFGGGNKAIEIRKGRIGASQHDLQVTAHQGEKIDEIGRAQV